jgi:hypothetical protein
MVYRIDRIDLFSFYVPVFSWMACCSYYKREVWLGGGVGWPAGGGGRGGGGGFMAVVVVVFL